MVRIPVGGRDRRREGRKGGKEGRGGEERGRKPYAHLKLIRFPYKTKHKRFLTFIGVRVSKVPPQLVLSVSRAAQWLSQSGKRVTASCIWIPTATWNSAGTEMKEEC